MIGEGECVGAKNLLCLLHQKHAVRLTEFYYRLSSTYQKQEHNDRNKEQNPAVLRYSHPYLWQRVLDNITKHGKEVGSHRNVISQKNATHILEGPCHK